MEMLVHVGWLIGGLALLSFGADWLVRGASELAIRAGLTPLVVGLTIVAFGTSAPELVVSLKANLDPNTQADIAVGNIVGSNICNIALLLGIAALIRPLVVGGQVVRREIPLLLVITGAFVAMIWDGELARWEGLVMTAGIILYVFTSLRIAKMNPHDPAVQVEIPEGALAEVSEKGSWWKSPMWIILGLGGLIFGADRLVTSGVAIATAFGVSQIVIGLTLVAIGTSLPELATTIAAVRRRETDIIAGNIIGSNVFNILAVMGIASAVKPITVQSLNRIDLAVMSGFTLALVPILLRGRTINRFEGGLLLIGYFVYCAWLVKPEWFGGAI